MTIDFEAQKRNKLRRVNVEQPTKMSGAEIKRVYEEQDDTNPYEDADVTKLAGIEAAATADQTGAEIKTAYQAEANAFTDTKNTKLTGIDTGAKDDQTGAEIKTAYQAEANAYTDTKNTKLAGIDTGADVTGSNPPQAHDLDSHNSCTLAELSTDISDDSVVGLAAAQTLTNKSIELDDALSSDHTYEGITTDDVVGENVVFGDLLYMKSDGKWWKGNNTTASSGESPIAAMAVATILADAAGKILLIGTVHDATWNFTTVGIVYAGADVPTHTKTTTSGQTVQIIGTSFDADRMFFNPDKTYVEVS